MKYSIDPQTNRLRITRMNKVLLPEGFFCVDDNNNLEYWLNCPVSWRKQSNLPEKITFIGQWKLNAQDDLQLCVDKASHMPESLSGISRITINGKIIAAQSNNLVFEVSSRDDRGLEHIRLLKLSGSWGTDGANKIHFAVTKRTEPDILMLCGTWSVNDNQQITYTLKKFDLITKRDIQETLDFTGYWQVSDKNRLAYIFSKGSGSRFDFKAQFETPNIYPAAGVIKYRLGSGMHQSKRGQPVIICLYGEWRFSRNAGLSFEMEYERGQLYSMRFGAKVNVSKNDCFEFSLVNEKGESLGGNLIFSHRFLKKLDAQFFVRLKKMSGEKAIEAGITIPF